MRRILSLSLIFAAVAMLLSSCNCYNQMGKNPNAVQAQSNPQVLTLKGNSVDADIKVSFPEEYFDQMAVMKITPVLVFEGGEVAATPKFVQGEGVVDNFTVIPYDEGGSYTQSVSFPYDSRMSSSKLVLRREYKYVGSCKKEDLEFRQLGDDVLVAQGVSALQNKTHNSLIFSNAFNTGAGQDGSQGIDGKNLKYFTSLADNYKRVQTISQEAQIMYGIQSSKVAPAQLTTDQVKLLENFVKENAAKDKASLNSVYAMGYASPDGPEDLNNKLSKERGESGKAAISKQLKDVEGATYDVASYGEDWDGFKTLVENLDIKDKALILQVLQMYDNPMKRDQEIKNMSSVFKVLAQDILPQLRRTKLSASADVDGLSDAGILDLARKDLNKMKLEELLHAATLTNDIAEKSKIYAFAANKYDDARAYNNLGVTLIQQAKFAEAKKALNKSASLKPSPEVGNNLGAVAIAEGNLTEAQKYLGNISTQEAKSNKGLIAIASGNYTEAEKNLSGYDKALAQVLDGNLSAAKTTLASETTAEADYLKAVIATREGNTQSAIANLKNAIAKNPNMKAAIKKDVEFSKLFELPEFLAL